MTQPTTPAAGFDLIPPGVQFLTPGEVAAIFRVDPKTVLRWSDAGRIRAVRTPGNHRRYRADDVRALLAGEDAAREVPR